MYISIHKRSFLLKLLLTLHISNLQFESESRIESSCKEKTNWISPSTKYRRRKKADHSSKWHLQILGRALHLLNSISISISCVSSAFLNYNILI